MKWISDIVDVSDDEIPSILLYELVSVAHCSD